MRALFIGILIWGFGSHMTVSQGWWSVDLTAPDANYYEIVNQMEDYYATNSRGKGSGYKQYRRWALRNESRYYPSGNIFNFKSKETKEFRSYLKNHPELQEQSRATNGNWVPLGPYEWTEGFSSSGLFEKLYNFRKYNYW